MPQGWRTAGGIFNVNPLERNGPGNSISPKCDFSVISDPEGQVMLRWLPSWNYADLSRSPMGYGLIQPGQQYQGHEEFNTREWKRSEIWDRGR